MLRRVRCPALAAMLRRIRSAVGWARNYMRSRPLGKQGGFDGMGARLEQLLADAAKHINATYDVDRLCRGAFMDRMRDLKARGGERLDH